MKYLNQAPLTRSLSGLLLALLVWTGCEQASLPTEAEVATDETLAASKNGPPLAGQYIIVLKDVPQANARAVAQGRAAELARGLGLSPLHTYGAALVGFSANVPEGRLNALRRHPRVAYVEADGLLSVPTPRIEAKPPWAGGGGGGSNGQVLPWGVDRIDAELNPGKGTGVHVYVLDTGIDADHPDLQANLGNGFAAVDCRGGCRAAWDDDHDHGTHVAGTIAALDNDIDVVGVAPQVTLHAVKVLSKSGSGTRSGIIAGIDWMASEVAARGQAAVANMSLGGSGSKTGTCSSSGFSGTDSYHEAICNATNQGVVFVVAAGNDGADAQNAAPAAYDDAVITVSATNSNDQWESWSNWGNDTAAWTTHTSAPVALGAPGGGILSTRRGGGTTTMSGTSMASPHAAGAAALVLDGTGQPNSYAAFVNVRNALLANDEDTASFGNENPSNPHAEHFLDAESL